jgi:ABC-type transport system involved in multi-copper enzyme maturation permease subunit
MSAWPVIVRELRAEARRPANYWLRVIGAGLLLLIVFASLGGMVWGPGASGRQLFVMLHWTLFASICLTVPLLTADCISGERREGTLGLLFLTPLTPGGIMAGKSFAHALRALMLVLVTLPVTGIAFVLGGITRLDLIGSLGMNLSALCLALAAGLIATTWAKQRIRALVLSEVLVVLLVFLFANVALLFGRTAWQAVVAPMTLAKAGLPLPSTGIPVHFANPLVRLPDGTLMPVRSLGMLSGGPVTVVLNGGQWSTRTTSWARLGSLLQGSELFPGLALANAPPGARELWVLVLTGCACAAAAILRTAIWLGGLRLRRLRQEEPPSPRQIWLRQIFCTPRALATQYHRRMTGLLDRNPIAWLQHYSWSARLVKWGWCGLIALTYSVNSFDFFLDQQPYVVGVFAAGIAFSAANSFRQERLSGALELLLVTPLTERQILNGRLAGIWWQFLPALAVWWIGYRVIVPLNTNWSQRGAMDIPYHHVVLMMWATLPVIGLSASLVWRNLFTAWLMTILVGLALPWIVFGLLTRAQSIPSPSDFTPMLVTQGLLAAASYQGMLARLRSRAFAL